MITQPSTPLDTFPSATTATTTAAPTAAANSQPNDMEGLQMPSRDEIHSHTLMPDWVQDIYSQLAAHAKLYKTLTDQQQQMRELLPQNKQMFDQNQKLTLALTHANDKIAELESQLAHTSPTSPASTTSATPAPEKRSDDTSASEWADLAAMPPQEAPPTTTSPKTKGSNPTNTNSNKSAPKTKAKKPMTLEQVSRFYSLPSKNQGYQFLYSSMVRFSFEFCTSFS